MVNIRKVGIYLMREIKLTRVTWRYRLMAAAMIVSLRRCPHRRLSLADRSMVAAEAILQCFPPLVPPEVLAHRITHPIASIWTTKDCVVKSPTATSAAVCNRLMLDFNRFGIYYLSERTARKCQRCA